MGLRETLNKRPLIAYSIVSVMVAIAAYVIYTTLSGSGSSIPTQVYYTADDGQTYYVDSAKLIPPFESDGKTVLRAFVYECHDEEFVNHLMRFRPDSHDAIRSEQAESDSPDLTATAYSAREIRRSGESEWVGIMSPKGIDILQIECPHGGGDYPRPVFP